MVRPSAGCDEGKMGNLFPEGRKKAFRKWVSARFRDRPEQSGNPAAMSGEVSQ
jgi:hypothetical protein